MEEEIEEKPAEEVVEGGEVDKGKGKSTVIPIARFNEINLRLKDTSGERDRVLEDNARLQTQLDELNAQGQGGKKTEGDELDPAIKSEMDRRDQQTNVDAAIRWVQERPEASEDPDFQTNWNYVMRRVCQEYNMDPKTNPWGAAKLTYRVYRESYKDMVKAAGNGGKGGETKIRKPDGLGHAGRDASRPVGAGAGKADGNFEFMHDQITKMDPVEYKEKRAKILAAGRAGKIG